MNLCTQYWLFMTMLIFSLKNASWIKYVHFTWLECHVSAERSDWLFHRLQDSWAGATFLHSSPLNAPLLGSFYIVVISTCPRKKACYMCFVSMCKNTIIKTPEKFIFVPKDKKMRKRYWLQGATSLCWIILGSYCYEHHFDVSTKCASAWISNL